ncbi:MAG TPA: biopolymer transporter ExbD [Opitutaceae bacterium]|jgi:biopolymer transport protein ExbD|nr:biopolymer transporter ExbD [Opitutaceae bacterium]
MISGLYQKRRKRPEMNLVPLIDVLVMLIFFSFVTMQFKSAVTMNITLPKFTSAGKNEFKGKVEIAINKDGVISFNGRAIADSELLPLLKQVHDVDRDIPVLIKADKTTQLQKVADVMNACGDAHLNKFSLQSQ